MDLERGQVQPQPNGRDRRDRGSDVSGATPEAAFEVVPVRARARIPVGLVKLAAPAAVLVVVMAVGSNLPGPRHDQPDPRLGASPSLAAPPLAVGPKPALAPITGTEYSEIAPGGYDVPWPDGRIRLTIPAGWLSAAAGWSECWRRTCWLPQAGTTITRYPLEGGSPTLTLNLVHDVQQVVVDACADGSTTRFVSVGPTVEDLSSALVGLAGIQRTGPTDFILGGYPTERFDMTPHDRCPGPEGHDIWTNAMTYPFAILKDGTATVYIIDVSGDRLVITSLNRGASAEDLAQLEAIIASIEIEPSATPEPGASPTTASEFLPEGSLAIGRHALTVAGISLSFDVSTGGAGNTGWGSNGAFYISKSIKGPQGAEAAILWTSFPDGVYPVPCLDVLGRDVGPSAADLAAAVARAPSDPIAVTGPSDVIVGGRAAKHVSLTVGDDHGCQPGFFYSWPDLYGGPLWGATRRGDTISVWIVDVDGMLLFIEGMTTTEASPEIEAEFQMFIDSSRFE